MPWPSRIEPDPIIEALLELQFNSALSTPAPELVVGSLADNPLWREVEHQRLPLADIPAPLRMQDLTMRFQPVHQLFDAKGLRTLKIGPNVLSYHKLAPYPGWAGFEPELRAVINFAFSKLPGLQVSRIGLRYINVLTNERHGVADVNQLNYLVQLGKGRLLSPQNLNYQRSHGPEHSSLTRVSSREFVGGPLPDQFGALIDLDVFTPLGYNATEPGKVSEWVASAHDYEKGAFFELLSDETIAKLGRE